LSSRVPAKKSLTRCLLAGQYQEFRNDVKNLAENLSNIQRVVKNAKATWTQQSLQLVRSRTLPQPKEWDLSSLREIIGDYHRTLEDCKKLLEENHEFRRNRNFAYNIEWNVVIQPKVEHLRKRLESHNSKISILLRPLELNLLSEIHRDLADRIDAVHQSVLHLEGLLISDVKQAMYEQERAVVIDVIVPVDIENKFRTSAEKSHPEICITGKFPLQAGADAFVEHFENSTKNFMAKGTFLDDRKPPPQQYLALLKSIWIMRCLTECDALRNASGDSQWPGYVQQLNENLSIECQRFTTAPAQRLIAPDLSSLGNDDLYDIWPAENIADYISPHVELALEEVLKLPMPSPSESLRHDISIFRLGSTKYRLLEVVEDRNAPSARRQEFKMEIDLKTVTFTPLYAVPSSRPKALEVVIASPTADIQPTFIEPKHILRLQHLLTGYKVYERYDQAMVTVSFFVSGQATPVEEHGRLQLWLPHHFGNSPNSASSSVVPSRAGSSRASLSTGIETTMSLGNSRSDITSSRFASPTGPLNPFSPTSSTNRDPFAPGRSRDNIMPTRMTSPSIPNSINRSRDSITNGNSRETMAPSRQSSRSASTKLTKSQRAPSIATSMMSTSSVTSRTSASSITTVSTGTGRAHVHSKPSKPLLVIFLKSKEASGKLAIVAIQIDDKTQVERERCLCRTSNSKCVDSCIERSGGNLLAQRWDADQGLGSWNLAKLGMEQRKELPADAWSDVKRATLKFDSLEGMLCYMTLLAGTMLTCLIERYKFSGSPCSCKPIMQHDLSRCITAGHHGVFGVVKQIGSQRLRTYHQERDQAAGRNIVLGSLPEDES
jgi:hypothetical protein